MNVPIKKIKKWRRIFSPEISLSDKMHEAAKISDISSLKKTYFES